MQHLNGLFLLGEFAECTSAKKKDGEVVRGLFRISVDVGLPFNRDASYFDVDRETGETTRIAEQVHELNLVVGERIAVRVTPRRSGQYTNLDAVQVLALDREDAAAL